MTETQAKALWGEGASAGPRKAPPLRALPALESQAAELHVAVALENFWL